MKKTLKFLGIAVVIAAVVGFGFTSCSGDDGARGRFSNELIVGTGAYFIGDGHGSAISVNIPFFLALEGLGMMSFNETSMWIVGDFVGPGTGPCACTLDDDVTCACVPGTAGTAPNACVCTVCLCIAHPSLNPDGRLGVEFEIDNVGRATTGGTANTTAHPTLIDFAFANVVVSGEFVRGDIVVTRAGGVTTASTHNLVVRLVYIGDRDTAAPYPNTYYVASTSRTAIRGLQASVTVNVTAAP